MLGSVTPGREIPKNLCDEDLAVRQQGRRTSWRGCSLLEIRAAASTVILQNLYCGSFQDASKLLQDVWPLAIGTSSHPLQRSNKPTMAAVSSKAFRLEIIWSNLSGW